MVDVVTIPLHYITFPCTHIRTDRPKSTDTFLYFKSSYRKKFEHPTTESTGKSAKHCTAQFPHQGSWCINLLASRQNTVTTVTTGRGFIHLWRARPHYIPIFLSNLPHNHRMVFDANCAHPPEQAEPDRQCYNKHYYLMCSHLYYVRQYVSSNVAFQRVWFFLAVNSKSVYRRQIRS